MSVINVEPTNRHASQSGRTIELPTSIEEKLHTVLRQTWRAELVYRLAMASAAGLLAIIGLIVVDNLVSLRSTPIRWAIWGTVIVSTVAAVRYVVVQPRRRKEGLLDAAWKIETSHPNIEERLTSTVQFLRDNSSQHASPQLIDALVTETTESVLPIDAESIPNRSSQVLVIMATTLVMALVISVALWPQPVLTSIDNLATPWSPYIVPSLSVTLAPGDVAIAEGDSVNIHATAIDPLEHPTLEITRGDVVESHSMVVTSPESATCTLTDVRQDAVYRVRSGGLFSVPHTITVHLRPELKAVTGLLKFPAYTQLEPLTLDQVNAPIEVPAGTEVMVTAISDHVAVKGFIRWNAEQKQVIGRELAETDSKELRQFEWTLRVEPRTELVGTLDVRSEHGLRSVPHPIEIRALEDSLPTIDILAPGLRQLVMRRDDSLPIRYRVIEDFGISKTELMVSFGMQEAVARNCAAPEKQLTDPRVSIGETFLVLADVPDDCQELRLWLRVSDNRPDEFGGAQVIESEAIHVTLDDRADSIGQQQVWADRQVIEQSIDQAMEQLREAAKAAEALQQDQGETDDTPRRLAAGEPTLKEDQPNNRADHIQTLRQETSKAKQTLDQVAKRLQEKSNLFQPKAAEIQQVADEEVSEALEFANEIPLTDDPSQQVELARGTQEQLDLAIDELDQLKADVEKQAELMEQAAKLDQLASKQDQLARKATKGDPDRAPEEQWRDRQEEVANELQHLVEENDEARAQQLLQRAEEAERLADQAQQLAQQQQQLEQAMRDAQQKDRKPAEAKQQLHDLIEMHKDEIEQQAKREGNPQNDKTDRAELDKAAAKLQEQIAQRAEEIQQEAEQLAKQDNPEPAIQERAKQAAEQLQQAKQKADQANQSLCEKCSGVGQPKVADEPKQAPRQDDAKINRDQQEAAQALKQASQSLNQVCQACRECANCDKPGSGESQSGRSKNRGARKGDQASEAKQLAKASDGAKQAARAPSKNEAAQNAEAVAEQLNQLADNAAQESGYSLRQTKRSPQAQDKQSKNANKPSGKPSNNALSGQPSADPQGVGDAAGDTSLNPQKLRAAANSNWTRSRQQLRGGVLNDREGNVPEQYRGVVERYFEELSRQQSSRGE